MEIRRFIARLPLIIEMKSHKRPVFSLVALWEMLILVEGWKK
jgi:hypothetical protein